MPDHQKVIRRNRELKNEVEGLEYFIIVLCIIIFALIGYILNLKMPDILRN